MTDEQIEKDVDGRADVIAVVIIVFTVVLTASFWLLGR